MNKNSWYLILVLGGAALLLPIALAAVPAQSAKPPGALEADGGKRLFGSAGCAHCHGADLQPPYAVQEFIDFVRHPSGAMRPYSKEELSDAQLGEIHAYLRSLPPSSDSDTSAANYLHSLSQSSDSDASAASVTGNAETGKQLFIRDGCYQCHGILGQGANGFGPRIGPDPVSMRAIMNYIRRPSGNMPPYTAKIVSNQDVADIYAYLKSVARPGDMKNIPLFTK